MPIGVDWSGTRGMTGRKGSSGRKPAGGARKPSAKRGAARAKSAPRKTSSAKGKAKPVAKKKAAARRPLWKRGLFWGAVAACWLIAAGAVALAVVAISLPDVGKLAAETRRPSITLVAADGARLTAIGDLYGQPVEVRDLPSHVPQAVLAIEDRRFYDHIGVDFWSVARALWVNIREGEVVQGGSTITQQLAKNLFLTPERTISRKLQEAVLAVWLEMEYGKDEILSLYLNRVYLGAGTYGVDAAARRYFDKSARELGLYEAAMIAGLLKAPSRLNPNAEVAAAEARAKVVLSAMVEAGFITQRQKDFALANKPAYSASLRSRGRYFADWVLGEVESRLGRIERDLEVYTSLDPRLQAIAEDELRRLLDERGGEARAGQGAVVLLSPDGAVQAMVGGRSYQESQFNRATQARRQPGSAFKLFVYLAALERGYRPNSEVVDGPVSIGGWSPSNYDGRYHGRVTLEEAFAKSYNTVAAQLIHEVGPARVAETARRLGVVSELEETPSLALGAYEVSLLELTGAFATLANRGRGVMPYGILEIRARGGEILFRRQGGGLGPVLRAEVLEQMHALTTAVIGRGTGRAAAIDRQAGGKTGTSQDSRDAWFVGYTADYAGGVWLGNDDNSPMAKVTGGGLPAELWGRIMRRAHESLVARAFYTPRAYRAPEPFPAPDETAGFIARVLDGLFGGDPQPEPAVQSGESAEDRLPPAGANQRR